MMANYMCTIDVMVKRTDELSKIIFKFYVFDLMFLEFLLFLLF